MIYVILSALCLGASAVGSIVGAGGGVIIKPVVDLFGLLPVSVNSFCAGCTVLSMSVVSLIRGGKSEAKLRLRMTIPLAIGAVLGGFVGKWLFELVRQSFGDENVLGAVQALVLTVITALVLLYVCKKDKIRAMNVQSIPAALVIGGCLGVISSFLGIGGGTSNVAVLFFFFSMDAKEAAKNSLFIIMCSQIASIAASLVNGTVPDFSLPILLSMIAGGVAGAQIGAFYSKRLKTKGVEKLLKLLLVVIICIDLYNCVKFSILIF